MTGILIWLLSPWWTHPGAQCLPPCQFINQEMLLPTGHKNRAHPQHRGSFQKQQSHFQGRNEFRKSTWPSRERRNVFSVINHQSFLLSFESLFYLEICKIDGRDIGHSREIITGLTRLSRPKGRSRACEKPVGFLRNLSYWVKCTSWINSIEPL